MQMDMARIVKEQLNLNTFLLMVVGALVTRAVYRADQTYELVTRHDVEIQELSRRADSIESYIGIATANGSTSRRRKQDNDKSN